MNRDEMKARLAVALVRKTQVIAEAESAIADRRLESEVAVAEHEGIRGRDFGAVYTPDGAVVLVRPPPAVVWQKYRDRMLAQKLATKDLDDLVHPCLEDVPAFEALCTRCPALLDLVANAVVSLAGMTEETLAGK
jgi:hypothetical protein